MPSNLFDELASSSRNRERLMKKIDTASSTLDGSASKSEEITETDILNFALNLEYLEAEFYTYAVTGKSLTASRLGLTALRTARIHPQGESPAAVPRSSLITMRSSVPRLPRRSDQMRGRTSRCYAMLSDQLRSQSPT